MKTSLVFSLLNCLILLSLASNSIKSLQYTLYEAETVDSQYVATMANLAGLYTYKNVDTALMYGLRAEYLADSLSLPFLLVVTKRILVTIYGTGADKYLEAKEKYIEALMICEQHPGEEQWEVEHARLLINSGGSIYLQAYNQKTLALLDKAQQLLAEKQEPRLLSACYTAKGLTYLSMEKYEEAIAHLEQALPLLDTFPDWERKFFININLAKLFLIQDKQAEALGYLNQLEVLESRMDSSTWASLASTTDMGEVYMGLGQWKKAYEVFQRMLASPRLSNSAIAKKKLSQIFARQGRFDSAYYYAQIYGEALRELTAEERKKQIHELEIQYETEKKELENARLQQENEALDLQNKLFFFASLGMLALATLAVLLGIQLRKNVKLQKQKLADFRQFSAEKDRLKGVLIHDLRTPLMSIQFGIFRLFSRIQDEPQRQQLEQMQHAAEDIQRLSTEVAKLDQYESDALKPELAPVALQPIIREVAAAHQSLLDFKHIHLTYPDEVTDDQALGNPILIHRCLSNLLANAIKYSPDGSSIEIGLERKQDDLVVWIKDEGPGLAGEEQELIFQPHTSLEKGNNKIQGTGNGLYFVKKFVEKMKGNIQVQASPQGGSIFSLSLHRIGDEHFME